MTILLPVAAAALVAGCTNVSDASVVARVGDAELPEDELEVYRQLVGGTEADLGDAESARGAISVWTEIQVLTQFVTDAGLEADPETIDAATQSASQSVPGFAELDDSTRELLVDYFVAIGALSQLTPPEDEIAAWFDAGAETTGLACVHQIVVGTEAEAEAIIVELDEGADFAALAVERSADPNTGLNGGFIACTSVQELASQLGPDFALAVVEAEPGNVTGPIEGGGGFTVLRIGTFDEHSGDLAPIIAQGYFTAQIAIADADIEVDSRYGTNDGVNVIPLG
jgi:peptidyl-prolyl cis-trans isomerase C